jgi:hypothetical protein
MNDEELKKQIKEAYKDGDQVNHHTKVYVTVLVVIAICLVAYLFLFGSVMSGSTTVTSHDEAQEKAGGIGASINDMADDLQGIEEPLG